MAPDTRPSALTDDEIEIGERMMARAVAKQPKPGGVSIRANITDGKTHRLVMVDEYVGDDGGPSFRCYVMTAEYRRKPQRWEDHRVRDFFGSVTSALQAGVAQALDEMRP